jgi:DNA-binding GntR family transcriptional regulator
MTRAALQPVDTTTLHERVYQELRTALMSGRFAPGQAVTLRGVAQDLGTSLMPVREAVRRLVSERALEMPTSRSIRVPLMSLKAFDQLCALRLLLEGEAAALAAPMVAGGALKKLESLDHDLRRRLSRGDVEGMLAVNREFHALVYAQSGNELLSASIEALWLQSGPYLTLLLQGANRDVLPQQFDEHDHLLDALRAGDGEAARRAIHQDISHAAELYRELIQP